MDIRALSLILSFVGAACTLPDSAHQGSCTSLFAGRAVTQTDPQLEVAFCDITSELARLEPLDDKAEWVVSLIRLTNRYSFLDFSVVERFLRKKNSRAYLFAMPLSQAPVGSGVLPTGEDSRSLHHFIYIDFGDDDRMEVLRKTFNIGTAEQNLQNLTRTGLLTIP